MEGLGASIERDAIAYSWHTSKLGRLREVFDQYATVGLNDALGCNVLRVRGDLDERQAFCLCFGEQHAERKCGVTLPLLPGHDCVANVPEAVWRQGGGTRQPTKADASAELTVP